MKISELRIYPIKSCRGISVDSAVVGARGFRFDRRAMIVDSEGIFISQRTLPKLAQVIVECQDDLKLSLGDLQKTVVFSERRKKVSVWRDEVDARIASGEVNSLLSDFLKKDVTLVLMDADSLRYTNEKFGKRSDVSFADGFPYLITTTASLQAISDQVGEEIPMDRFRPNIVIETDDPWLEDDWRDLYIGGHHFDLRKPCTRCVITTLDQITGDAAGQSTMEALVKLRARSGDWGRGVIFGVNAVTQSLGGSLTVGMDVLTEAPA